MKYLKSFLNYPGGKYRLLNQILPYFPKQCHTFIDLFTGSGVVTENYHHAQKYIVNDINTPLIKLQKYIIRTGVKAFSKQIKALIKYYRFTDTYKYSYKYYHMNSSKGLAKCNRLQYLKLRQDYNQKPSSSKLYLLIVFGFNNQIRFNAHHFFNNPCGKRDWNSFMRKKLKQFYHSYKNKKIVFKNTDFQNISVHAYDFIYADPPYSITDAVYTGGQTWNNQNDRKLFSYLDKANGIGAKFALSNVFESKGKVNHQLIRWAKKYHIYHLSKSYNNSNYHTKNGKTDEVLITNY